MDRSNELESQLQMQNEREEIEGRLHEDEQKHNIRIKGLIKEYFESRKEFMMANRYKKGKNWIYPTSEACLKRVGHR